MRHIVRMTTEGMIERIKSRLKELQLTPRAASLKAGGSPDMLRIILSGRTGNPRADTLAKIANVLQVDEQWLLHGGVPPEIRSEDQEQSKDTPADTTQFVPVMGTAAGSIIADGVDGFDIAGPVDYVPVPPALMQSRGVYAIYVSGESMSPQHNPGDLRFVHPHRPAQPGCTVIVQTRKWDDDPGQAYIKILEKRSGDRLFLKQINPPATLEIPTAYIRSIHRVMTMNELFGV